jgi:hypothetical protein
MSRPAGGEPHAVGFRYAAETSHNAVRPLGAGSPTSLGHYSISRPGFSRQKAITNADAAEPAGCGGPVHCSRARQPGLLVCER